MNMKHLYTSLDSGVTSGSVTDNSIIDDSVIEIYFDNTDCYIDSTSQSGHTVYFTVGGNATGTNVCVVVNNLTNFTPYDDTNVMQRVSTLETDVETLDNLVTTLETDVETLETRVDGLNASNINYDEHSTLYSAMGDIDELETTSKNLVGAINEVKESGGGGGQSYSTTEQVIGTWFGKPLYRKCYNITSPTSLGTNHKAFDIETSMQVINMYGFYNGNTPINYYINSNLLMSTFINSAKNAVYNYCQGVSQTNLNGVVILEYTKTTD